MQVKLLAIGYDPAIMKVVERLLNSHAGWTGIVAPTKEEGLAKLKDEPYDAVLLCVGVTAQDEASFREAAKSPAKVIRHYGGGSGLLENEVRAALGL
jgi:DNA-binding response OmpR family regulator